MAITVYVTRTVRWLDLRMLAMISFLGETRSIGKGNRMSDRTLWIIYVVSSLMAGIGFIVLLGCLLIAAR